MKNKSPADVILGCFGVVVLLGAVIYRLRLLHLPIDRDEGEYAYAGWRMGHGGIPFRDYYNMKMPGIYAVYAMLFLVFGATIESIRWGLIIVNLVNTFWVFKLAEAWISRRTGIYASICYLVFSIQVELQGTCSHAEHFAMFFVLPGMFFLTAALKTKSSRNLFLSGIFFGLGFLMKQPVFSFLIMAIIFLWIDRANDKTEWKDMLKSSGILVMGAVIPLIACFSILIAKGAGENFLLFAFRYAREYISYMSLQDGYHSCLVVIASAARPGILLWLLVPIAMLVIFIFGSRKNILATFLFFIFSFLAVTAGFYFRPHYFQFLLPALSVIVASGLSLWESFWSAKDGVISKLSFIPFPLLVIAIAFFIYNERTLFAIQKDEDMIRRIYGLDFFNATKRAGDFIAVNSAANDRIAIFGAEPEICFYAKRPAASGYLYVYPLLEKQKYAPLMRKQFYNEVLNSRPQFLVYVSNAGTWYANEAIHLEMVRWYESYRDSSYKRIALIDMPDGSATVYHWTEDTTIHPLNAENYIEICKRR